MIDLTQYGYIEAEKPLGLIPGRVTELQRDQYTVITEQGEVTAVLKGAFYHAAGTREDFPCVGDYVYLQYNDVEGQEHISIEFRTLCGFLFLSIQVLVFSLGQDLVWFAENGQELEWLTDLLSK